MKVYQVTKDDMPEIARWSEWRGLPEWPGNEWLSDLGFWVPRVCAGWLVTTNSPRALLEDFIANPRCHETLRGEALFALERHIADEARRRGFKFLIGTTKLRSVRERVRIAGYEVSEPVFSLHRKVL